MTSEVSARYQFQHLQQHRNRANFLQSLESASKVSTSSVASSTDFGPVFSDDNKKQGTSNQVLLSATQLNSQSSSASSSAAETQKISQLTKAQQQPDSEHEEENNFASGSNKAPHSVIAHVTQNQSEVDQSSSTNNNMTQLIQQQQQEIDEQEEQGDSSSAGKQHHVGPVMGIFFKVWSLVKVTKVRHNQRMRRQASEEPSNQFQYSEPQSTMGLQQQASHHVLEDRHFRRAGSQPARSTSTRTICDNQPLRPFGAGSNNEPNSSLLLQAPIELGSNSTGTNSTSTSGVSSATSSGHLSMMNTCGSHSSNSPIGSTNMASYNQPNSSLASGVKRHVSAYTSRRSTADTPIANLSRKSQLEEQKQNQGSSSSKSWASKIKRSATSVNQTDFSSYMSRYRASRRERSISRATTTTAATTTTKPQVSTPISGPTYHLSSSRATALQRRLAEIEPERQLSETTSEGGYELDNEDEDERTPRLASGERDEDYNVDEEEDSNDIYSTPNDSIQSVPSTAPVVCRERMAPPAGVAVHQVTSQAYPIIKSFSTSNFGQLVRRQESLNSNKQKMDPVKEFKSKVEASHERFHSSTSSSSVSPPSSRNKQQALANNPIESSKQHKLNDSKFFISSSSSEDSNSPAVNQQQQIGRLQQLSDRPSCQQNSGYQLEQQLAQIALSKGVHYHSPTNSGNNNLIHFAIPQRPHSLLLGNCQESGVKMSPSLISFGGGGAAINGCSTPSNPNFVPVKQVAAITPLDSLATQPTSFHQPANNNTQANLTKPTYRKSPSMMEISKGGPISSRFSSKYPVSHHQSKLLNNNHQNNQYHPLSSFRPAPPTVPPPPLPLLAPSIGSQTTNENQISYQDKELVQTGNDDSTRLNRTSNISNSVSLYDCKLSSHLNHFSSESNSLEHNQPSSAMRVITGQLERESEYKLAQMLLESGSNPNTRDADGCTALMHAVISDNLPAIKCLVEHGVDLNVTNNSGLSALDFICSKTPTSERVKILKLLIENGAHVDQARETDGSRLLDRLIGQHLYNGEDKLLYIDCLLQNGAKLGSSTWTAAYGKHEVQLRLLKKLCQDGYFLYKTSSIEAAVYRFEYALRRIAELEQQLANGPLNNGQRLMFNGTSSMMMILSSSSHSIQLAVRQIKFQTYLGLSRCERKRKFYKRALEFANMTILVDSSSYEGYYSKAHILKDLGETDDSLLAIDQTSRLVERSIEGLLIELHSLRQQEESLVFDGCFSMQNARHSEWIESSKLELTGTLEYLNDAKKYISNLKAEILDDKLRQNHANSNTNNLTNCINPVIIT